MFKELFESVLKSVLPMIFIFTIIIISIRLFYLITNKQKIVLYKELLMLVFIIYILLLYYIVTFQDSNYGTNNFIPFKEIFRYNISSRLFIKNVVGNILLFIPFGFFVTYYVKNKKIFQTLFLCIISSVAIEFTQYSIGRVCDIDDIILNVIGGCLGYFIAIKIKKIISKLSFLFKNKVIIDMLSLIMILVIIYILFRLNFWRYLD